MLSCQYSAPDSDGNAKIEVRREYCLLLFPSSLSDSSRPNRTAFPASIVACPVCRIDDMVEIQFLLEKPGPGSESRREHELRDSAARSHASKVTHSRAKLRIQEIRQVPADEKYKKSSGYHDPSASAKSKNTSSSAPRRSAVRNSHELAAFDPAP